MFADGEKQNPSLRQSGVSVNFKFAFFFHRLQRSRKITLLQMTMPEKEGTENMGLWKSTCLHETRNIDK